MRKPVAGNPTITTRFGVANSYAKFSRHSGIDYSLPIGTPVYAPSDGEITNITSKTGGNMVVIKDSKGLIHRLMHNSKFLAQNGSKIKEGDKVALSGNTGLSTGPHLHWDINKEGVYPTSFDAFLDPDKLLKLKEEEMLTNEEDAVWIWRTVKQKHSPTDKEKKEYTGKNLTKLLEDLSNDADVLDFKEVYRVKYPAALKTIAELQKALLNEKNKKPETIVKEVEKIVSKIEYIDKPAEIKKPQNGVVEFLVSKLRQIFKR